MKVFYTGKYREPAVNYHGATFVDGVATEVTDEWFALHSGPNVVEAGEPIVVTDAPFYEAPKKRGRPARVKADHDD